MENNTRKCKVCLRILNIEDFEKRHDKKGDFTRKVCRTCHQEKRLSNFSNSPENFLRNLHTQLKSSRKDTHAWEIDYDYILQIWNNQNGKCALSGLDLMYHKGSGPTWFNVSIDRKNSNKDYVVGNIQLVCSAVNMMKQSMNDVDFIWWCKTITTYKENNI